MTRKADRPEHAESKSADEARLALHELRVHQIELEAQNEELRKAKAELAAERARYFDLYDLAPAGYCTLSEQGLILDANLAAARLFGLARSALARQPISRFILNEDQDIYYLRHKQLFETREPQECDLRMVKADGTVFRGHLAETVAQHADGSTVCPIVLSDITARKGAEEALVRANERLALAQRSAGAGMWDWDIPSGRLTWSPELYELFGLELEATAPTFDLWRAALHPEDRQKAEARINDAIRERTRLFSEYRVVLPTGEVRWINALGDTEYD